jgi:uncharacterized protein (DUF433 family)
MRINELAKIHRGQAGSGVEKPVAKGTRLMVEFILERLGDGATVDDLVANYVGLTPDHIGAATAYAAALPRRDELVYSA